MLSCLLALVLAAPVRDVDRVVVVRNDNSPVSRLVADDYARRRGVRNVVAVACQDSASATDRETISYEEYRKSIEAPLAAFLAAHPRVDYIVLTKGVPIRIADAPGRGMFDKRPSLDSFLASLDYAKVGAVDVHVEDSGFTGTAWLNRFWNSTAPFSHTRFGGYLVTRLDGYTAADAMALTTRALQAERKRPTGPVLLDTCPGFGFGDPKAQPLSIVKPGAAPGSRQTIGEESFSDYNADMSHAADLLKAASVPVELDKRNEFVGKPEGLMGYTSWGSNDQHYDAGAYHSLRFAPGAICETAVSTSARTFLPTTGGQSLIADLVAQGATGVKGYTDEPLLQAVASPSVLFERYTRGWTLAESYYAASRFVGWEDIVVGDPICRPYCRQGGRPGK